MTNGNDRFLTAIFCDDIRYEKGDKESYVGCYLQENLFVPSVPIGLARFCIYVDAYASRVRPFRSLTFRVVQDGTQEVARFSIPENELSERISRTDEASKRLTISASFFFSPLRIEKPMLLQVFADTEDDDVLEGPQLFFRVDPYRVPEELNPRPRS